MNDTHGLFPTTEIMTVFLSYECSKNAELHDSVKQDVKTALLALTDIDFKNMELTVAYNSGDDIALVLPYYSHVEELNAFSVQDRDLSDTSGGEILATIIGTFGAVGYALGIGALSFTTYSGYTAGAVAAGLAIVIGPIVATLASITIPIGVGVGVGVNAQKEHDSGEGGK